MPTTPSKPISSPFPMSEQELEKRMEASKALTQKQFLMRLKEIKPFGK